jgi:hypothetical protein
METAASFGVGLLIVVIVTVAWVAVQRAWLAMFPREGADPDALARRMGERGCACGGVAACERREQRGGRS